jgi:hypothetical protein
MNLVFRTVEYKHIIGFPFQTPTDLTYSVLDESDKDKRLKLLIEHINSWEISNSTKIYYIKEIIQYMDDPTLELTMV